MFNLFGSKKKTIYIVEDDPSLQKLLEKQISKKYKANIKVFSDVKSCIKTLERKKPDIIISDVKMPGTSGFYITEYLSKKEIGIPLIYVTALKDHLDVADKYTIISKPIDFDKLFKLINSRLAI